MANLPAGTGGTGKAQLWDSPGTTKINEQTQTIATNPINYATNLALGTASGVSSNQSAINCLISDFIEIPTSTVSDADITTIIQGTYVGTISRHLTGTDVMANVGGTYIPIFIDDAVPTRMWAIQGNNGVYTPAVTVQPTMLIPGA